MNKKELKKFINENGFFVHIDNVEKVERNSLEYNANAIKTKAAANVPKGENIMFFKGLATQAFGVGEASRNMYKIDVNGWDWKNYVKNPQILLQHNDNEPIGKTLEIYPQDNGIEILYYVDLDALEPREAHKVKTGLYAALSTGHITHEIEFEHEETGERISLQEYRGLTWEEGQKYINVVTKAEAVEISVVSLPSNADALTTPNGIALYFKNILMKNKPQIKKNEEEAAETPKAPVEGAEEKEKTPAEEAPKETTEKSEEAPAEAPEKEGETPEAPEEPAENAEETDEEPAEETPEDGENKVPISKEDYEKLINKKKEIDAALNGVKVEGDKVEKNQVEKETNELLVKQANALKVLGNALIEAQEEISTLKNDLAEVNQKLDKIPVIKGNKVTTQFNQFGSSGDQKKPAGDTKTNGIKPGDGVRDLMKNI